MQVEVLGREWPSRLPAVAGKAQVMVNGTDDLAAGLLLYRTGRAAGRPVIDAYTAPLPSVTVVRPGDPMPEERLGFPTRRKAWHAVRESDRRAALLAEIEYVLIHSSARRHIEPAAAAEVVTGRRSPMSFATMVIGDRHADGARGDRAAAGAAHRDRFSRLVPQSGKAGDRASAPSARRGAAAAGGAAAARPDGRGAMIGVDDTAVVADSVVNLFAAAGLLLVARANRRLDPRGALTRRIAFALSFTAVFFFVRAAAWLSGAIMLDRLTTALAGAVPLAGLLVAEGVLRRHAPLWLKIAAAAGCVLPGLALVLRLPDAAVNLVNLCVVFAGFGAVAWLLVRRDPAGLTAAENRLIRRLVAVLIVLLPLIATDFRSIFPAIPVRLGAVGALVILYVGFGAGGLTTLARTRVFAMLAFLVIAGCFALAFGMIRSGGADIAELVRVEAVGFSGLMLAGLLSEELGAQGERAHPPGPLLLADDPERFAAALATHPLLADARILAGDALADVAGADFTALLARASGPAPARGAVGPRPARRRRRARAVADRVARRDAPGAAVARSAARHAARAAGDRQRSARRERDRAGAAGGRARVRREMGAATDSGGSAPASSPPLAGESRRGGSPEH